MKRDVGAMAWDAAVAATCAKYGSDDRHGSHVASLARELFEAFSPLHRLGSDYERILRHAAHLHDIGYFVAAKGHHRHGAYIVKHDEQMREYPLEDRLLLAGIVRNHRKRARPAPREWPRERRQALLWLSALLRVADALDYDHTQAAGITGVLPHGSGFEIVVQGLDLRPPIARLVGKADLLRDLSGGPIRFAEARR